MAGYKDLVIQQGRTFKLVLRWETLPIVYKAIESISLTAPLRLVAPDHGIPDGWDAAITGVDGIDSDPENLYSRDFHQVTVLDANTLEINDINASGFRAYVSGGYIQYNTPVDLTGFGGRMKIKDKLGGTVLASTELEDAPLNFLSIFVDTVAKTITLTIAASATEDIAWKKGVYDLEMVSGDVEPVITALLTGKVSVTREVTT